MKKSQSAKNNKTQQLDVLLAPTHRIVDNLDRERRDLMLALACAMLTARHPRRSLAKIFKTATERRAWKSYRAKSRRESKRASERYAEQHAERLLSRHQRAL